MEKFSIITVTYNVEKSLKTTINSVMGQKNKKWEYVFIDGSSTDNTVNLIKRYKDIMESEGIHVILISEPDKGIYDAMNKGVQCARGEWITFLNAGDVLFSENVLNEVETYTNNDNSIIYGDAVTSTGQTFATRSPWMLPYKKPFYHQAAFIKREVQERYPFNLTYSICADFDMFQRAYVNGEHFCRINSVIVKSDDQGVSKDPRNRYTVIEQDLKIIRNNGIKWYKHPFLPYFILKRKQELRKLSGKMK